MRTTKTISIAMLAVMGALTAGGGIGACGSSCESDELQFCPCLGGGTGAQQCDESGDYWSVCSCGSDQNDTLALALTGHGSHQQTVDPRIMIAGTTPGGRGTLGIVQVLNHLSSPDAPMTISFSVIDGAYNQEVSLITGTNEVSLLILEQEETIAEVEIVVDVLDPEGDTEHLWDPYADTDTHDQYAEGNVFDTDTGTGAGGIGTANLGGGGGLEVTVWEIGTDTGVDSPTGGGTEAF